MISTRFYLDTRGIEEGNEAPMKLCITHRGKAAYIPIEIRLTSSQWSRERQKVVNHPNKDTLNLFLESRKANVDNIIREAIMDGKLRKMTITQIKNYISETLSPEQSRKNLFLERFRRFAASRTATRTQEIYLCTLKKIQEFDSKAQLLSFDMIRKEWIESFSSWMEKDGLAKNSRNIHLRNIKAVINDAIDNGITNNYPVRKVDMSAEETEKRSLSVEMLRELFSAKVEKWQERYLDFFKLTFFLIGINPKDMLFCPKDSLHDGRLVYKRAKTGKLYSIKVEPEALEIIERYKGKERLVNFGEGFNNYKAFIGKTDKGLKSIGSTILSLNPAWKEGSRKHKYHIKRIPMFPNLSIYWARHTWATIAYSLDITDETIAASLGHGHGNKTTAIYIDKSIARIDEANRKVIDYVLYNRSAP